jgi:hypothetical protein
MMFGVSGEQLPWWESRRDLSFAGAIASGTIVAVVAGIVLDLLGAIDLRSWFAAVTALPVTMSKGFRAFWLGWLLIAFAVGGYQITRAIRSRRAALTASRANDHLDFGADPTATTEPPESMNHTIGQWVDVVHTRKITVDWTTLPENVSATVTLTATVSGAGQVGIFEPEVGIVAVTPVMTRVEPLGRTISLDLPRLTGARTYSLVFRRYETTNATLHLMSAVLDLKKSVAPFRTMDLGGLIDDYVPFVNEHVLWQSAAAAKDVEIDWDAIGPAVATATVRLSVDCPRGECEASATVRLRDLTDDSVFTTDDKVAAPTHGGVGWLMRGEPDVMPSRGVATIYVTRKVGVHRYRLEIGVSRPGFRVAAAGQLQFFR